MNTLINIITTVLLILWGGALMMSPMMIVARGIRDSSSSILFVMAVLSYPIVVFLLLKLLGFRYFGMNVNGWLIAVSIVSLTVIFVYGLPGLLLNVSKGIPNNGYFIDASAVYLDGSKLRHADPKSFTVFPGDDRYAKDDKLVFYYGKMLRNADPKYFTPILSLSDTSAGPQSAAYWKDQSRVYHNGSLLQGADAGSFTLIEGAGSYAKDNAHVYFMDQVLAGAAPAQFRFLSEGIGTDGEKLYIYSRPSETKVDMGSFTQVEGEYERFYRDRDHVYLLFVRQPEPLALVEGADPASFTTLDRSYAKDDKHVYFFGNYQGKGQRVVLLEGADPKAFTIGYNAATRSEAHDGKRHYMYGEVVPQK